MSDVKHTPGPWVILNKTTGSVGSVSPYQMTASVYGDHEECEPDERMLANARLIAAAPDLLEALEALYAVARVDRDEDYAAVTNAAAVIAKATGDQQ